MHHVVTTDSGIKSLTTLAEGDTIKHINHSFEQVTLFLEQLPYIELRLLYVSAGTDLFTTYGVNTSYVHKATYPTPETPV